ncbi:MAG: energy-coupling factor ABC transporter ATP-binding protein [Halobacteriota archaeon]
MEASLSIQRGSFTLLVGPSGCGKSTLCMLMNGIIPHLLGGQLSGDVTVDGHDIAKTAVKDLASSVGMLFQDPEWMFATLRVEDEIAFGPENLRVPREEIITRVDTALEFVGMGQLRQNLVWALSGGQIQKLGLAAVLAMETPLIVLDEPTANLDPYSAHSLMELLDELHGAGKTILIATHEVDVVCEWADRVCVLHNGVVVRDSTPAEAFSDAALMAETRLRPPIVYRVFEGITNPTPTSIRQARDKLKKLTQK